MEQRKSTENDKGKIQVGKTPMRSNTDESVDGGLNRSSDEAPVMGVERRVGIIQPELPFATSVKGRKTNCTKARGIPITQTMVNESYRKVKRNKGSAGIDEISLETFALNAEANLYKIQNRMSSGSYFPKGVKQVSIPKKDGKTRELGIPTVEDRIAQQVVKEYLESRFEREFHDNSYGYRPLRNAHHALGEVRKNVRKYDWVVDMDIKGFFDEVSHELLMKALDKLVDEKWVKMYIQRWLEAPVQTESNGLVYREGKGTPQGGVISPLLANLYLHYVFDKWMSILYPHLSFVRYADDIIVHCTTKEEAEQVLAAIHERMTECHLRLHEVKTKIVFCKKYKKQSTHSTVKFDFLGFSFMPRPTALKGGRMILGYDCAISQSSESRIIDEIKRTNFQRWTNKGIEVVADYFNPKLLGWLHYYGKFRRHKLYRVIKIFQNRLHNWVRKRFKRLNGSYIKACKWLATYRESNPKLFAHWIVDYIY